MAARAERIAALLLAAPAPVMAADSGMTASQAAEIAELHALCSEAVERPRPQVGPMPPLVSTSCSESLESHFVTKPIWDGTALRHAVSDKASGRETALNERADHLGYTSADWLPGGVPTWGDILDTEADERVVAVYVAFDDPVCAALNDGGGIQVALNERCHARDLFKYAARTDACAARLPLLMRRVPGLRDGASLYEAVHESLRESAEEATNGRRVTADEPGGWDILLGVEEEPTSRDGSSVAETALLATWLVEKCAYSAIVPFGDAPPLGNAPPPSPKRSPVADPGVVLDMAKPGHDAALSIAARAGDPWAVQAFHVDGLADDVEYWKSLRDFNPLLFHRWMATDVGATMGLDRPNRALHALMAFLIERRTEPDLELDRYLGLYGLSREFIHSPSRYGSALPDASAIEERLRYPWDRSR